MSEKWVRFSVPRHIHIFFLGPFLDQKLLGRLGLEREWQLPTLGFHLTWLLQGLAGLPRFSSVYCTGFTFCAPHFVAPSMELVTWIASPRLWWFPWIAPTSGLMELFYLFSG